VNPGLQLPRLAITVAHRSDGSGTTYIFTNYLAAVSPPWLTAFGVAKTISWPTGVGGQGNQGVASLVADIPGAIGYVELDYALQAHLATAALRNAAGSYVAPSLRSVAADAAMKPHVTASDFSIVNQQGANSYPIAGYSWTVVYAHQTNEATGSLLASLLMWLTHSGQRFAGQLGYVPLPKNIESLAAATIRQMTGPGGRRLAITAG
jgi:phosphate transport system substrate-binding protein